MFVLSLQVCLVYILLVSLCESELLYNLCNILIFTATQALQDANWFPENEQDRCKTGVSIGCGIGSLKDISESSIVSQSNPRKVSPFFVPRILLNMASGHVSLRFGFCGPNHCVSTACATGAHSIGDAYRMIQFGG